MPGEESPFSFVEAGCESTWRVPTGQREIGASDAVRRSAQFRQGAGVAQGHPGAVTVMQRDAQQAARRPSVEPVLAASSPRRKRPLRRIGKEPA